MTDLDFKRSIKLSYILKIQQLAARAEQGDPVEKELLLLTGDACKHLCAMNTEEPAQAVEEFIGGIRAQGQLFPETRQSTRRIFALAVRCAESYRAGLRP